MSGHSVACDGAMLVFASENEYGVKLAGGFGTPRVAPFWRSRASSLVPSSQSNKRCWIVALIAEITWLS